jgi:ElaB/YqjD/DUF883 family membrane-anchored ribosome-binding protein
LPSFAFDYSEFIASAVIERATDTDDLYLNVLFVGHRSIFNNFPFETISTDEEVLHKWGQAIKKWKLENSRYNHDILKRSPKKLPHAHHQLQSQANHALSCALHNNEDNNSPPYISTGHWITSDYLPDHVHGNFEILRCKLKGIRHFYDSLIHSDRHLSVDILSRGSRYPSSSSNSSSSSAVDHRDVIMSFYVPWRTRVTGYGLEFDRTSSILDPWEHLLVNSSSPTDSSASKGSSTSLYAVRSAENFLCAADYQHISVNNSIAGVDMGTILRY